MSLNLFSFSLLHLLVIYEIYFILLNQIKYSKRRNARGTCHSINNLITLEVNMIKKWGDQNLTLLNSTTPNVYYCILLRSLLPCSFFKRYTHNSNVHRQHVTKIYCCKSDIDFSSKVI